MIRTIRLALAFRPFSARWTGEKLTFPDAVSSIESRDCATVYFASQPEHGWRSCGRRLAGHENQRGTSYQHGVWDAQRGPHEHAE